MVVVGPNEVLNMICLDRKGWQGLLGNDTLAGQRPFWCEASQTGRATNLSCIVLDVFFSVQPFPNDSCMYTHEIQYVICPRNP